MSLKCRPARKKEKGKILDALIDLAGYNRSYAARVLRAIEAVTVARSMGFKVLIDFNCRARPWSQDRPREVMTRLMEDGDSLITIW